MATSIQHASNLRIDAEVSGPLFRNDLNNVAALQDLRLQKKKIEAEAKLQEQRFAEVAEDKEKVVQERDKLKTLLADAQADVSRMETETQERNAKVGELTEQVRDLSSQLSNAVGERDNFKRLKGEAEVQVIDLTSSNEAHGETIRSLKILADSLQDRCTYAEKIYEYGGRANCLPKEYHGAYAMIINARSFRALDAGYDSHSRGRGHNPELGNSNQLYNLTKWNGAEDASSGNLWIITSATNSAPEAECHIGGSAPNRTDYWYIGFGKYPGTWYIKNAEWNTYLELGSQERNNGVTVRGYAGADRDWDACWIIVPVRWA